MTKNDAEIAAEAKADAAGETVAGRPGEGERARAYLDLWERNLVHLALYGPGPRMPADPPARRGPKAG